MAINVQKVRAMAAKVVVPFSEEYAQSHREFAARMWPNDERRRDARYSQWKFRAPRARIIEGLLLAIQDKKVVGQIGLTTVMARIKGRQVPAQWACDYMVDPAYRIRGFGPMLMAEAVCKDVLTLADNPTPEAASVMKAFGFQEHAGPQRMLLPINAAHILSWKMPRQPRTLIRIAGLFAQLVLAWRTRMLRQARRADVMNSTWQELLETVSVWQQKLEVPHIIHDRSFLAWRFSNMDEFSEQTGALRTKNGYLFFGKGRRYLYALDWAAENWEECRALFAGLCLICKHMSAETISVLANTSRERDWLQSLGFFAVPTPVKIYSYSPKDLPLQLESFRFCHCDSHANL